MGSRGGGENGQRWRGEGWVKKRIGKGREGDGVKSRGEGRPKGEIGLFTDRNRDGRRRWKTGATRDNCGEGKSEEETGQRYARSKGHSERENCVRAKASGPPPRNKSTRKTKGSKQAKREDKGKREKH